MQGRFQRVYNVLFQCACVMVFYYDLLLLAAPKERHLGLRVYSPCRACDLHRVEVWLGLHHVQTSLRNCRAQTNILLTYILATLQLALMNKRPTLKDKLWPVFKKNVLILMQRYRFEVFKAIKYCSLVLKIIQPLSSSLGSYRHI
jgi:hypothetical protein